MSSIILDLARAEELAGAPLSHVTCEFPNKLDHVMDRENDASSPRALHPIFFGSFDWHSCVHGWWTMFTLRRLYPELSVASQIDSLADSLFTVENAAAELAYLDRPFSTLFERPYGWAWLLMLAAELHRHDTAAAKRWSQALAPLTTAFADRFKTFLPKSPYPVRAGVQTNTAFALRLVLEYARQVGDDELAELCRQKANAWYGADRAHPDHEPSQDEFLSPTLIEAELMRHVLAPGAFAEWLDRFLPATTSLDRLLAPPTVTDRSDGKIAHLDGLSLSRAWCWRGLARALGADQARAALATRAADDHLAATLPHIADDYMGQHWLASYVLLAMDADRGGLR